MAIYNINYLNESMSVQDMSPVFQKIFNIIDNNIKYSFEKLIVKGIITEGSYEYKFWLYDRGKTVDCYKILSHKECLNIFMKIDKEVRPIWNKLNNKDKFRSFEVEYNSDGSFKSSYKYEEENN